MKLLESINIGDSIFEVFSDRPSFNFFEVNQVHGTTITHSTAKATEADGIIATNSSDILAIKTADCMPVAYVGNNRNALIHAGWRGLVGNIIVDQKLIELDPSFIYIGPHIKKCCFEVSKGFENNFINGSKYLQENSHFDLTSYALDLLTTKFPKSIITVSDTCTCCNSQYNSYRRNKTNIRNYNILKNGE